MKKFIIALIFLVALANSPLLANMPREVVVLRFPTSEQQKWRETHRVVKKSTGEIGFVPFRQRAACCKESIEVSYLDRSLIDSRYTRSMKTVLNLLSSKVIEHKTWKAIDVQDDHALVEWTDALTHNLVRIFLTEQYVHLVSISSNEEPNEEERLARTTMLKNVPCVLPAKAALSAGGMCILAPWSVPVNMNEGFPGWRLMTTQYRDDGERVFEFVRKWQKEEDLREAIVLTKLTHQESFERAFEIISLVLRDKFKQINIIRLAQNESELAFMFEAKDDGQPFSKVIRYFRNDEALISLSYERVGTLSKTEVASWLEKMRAVKFD